MKLKLTICSVLLAVFALVAVVPASTVSAQPTGTTTSCSLNAGGFLGFPAWYKYLNAVNTPHGCAPQISKLSDIWLIGLAIIEIMLRLAALAAILFVLWGGIKFITSQGEPAGTKAARETVINALIGLVIAVGATAVVSFIAGRFT